MKLPETFEHMGGLGKTGAVAMAAGTLAMVGALGLDFANSVEINHSPLVDVEEKTTVMLLGGGLTMMFGGQQMLIRDRRRQQNES